MRHETKIIKHIASKLTPELLDWRPTPNQRSVGELLQYLPVSAEIPCVNLFTNNWDHAEATSAKAASITLETFDDAMDAQMNKKQTPKTPVVTGEIVLQPKAVAELHRSVELTPSAPLPALRRQVGRVALVGVASPRQ